MKTIYSFLLFFLLLSCKQRFFRAPSGSMAETIPSGEQFRVVESDKFERNDIAVFDYFGPDYAAGINEEGNYQLHWEKRVFRIIAYSGDSVQIKDGDVFLNGDLIRMPPKAKMMYEVLATTFIEEFNESYIMPRERGDTVEYFASLTQQQAENYRQRKPAIISVKKKMPDFNVDDTMYARASDKGIWTPSDYGPFKIPSPGDVIEITPTNLKFFHNIPGIAIGKHEVKEKLYFLLGDNRFEAEDSRYIGLITHSKMYGIVK